MTKFPFRALLCMTLVVLWVAGFLHPDWERCTSPHSDPQTVTASHSRLSYQDNIADPEQSSPKPPENPPISDQPSLEETTADTLPSDTIPPPKEEGIDTTISYWADEIDFDVLHRITTLTGHARVQYKTMTLEAAWIHVDWNTNLMTAGGKLDTIYTDSTQTEIDTIAWVGQPVYTDAGDVMKGDQILYNYKTKKGRVLNGSTQYLEGYYWGERIKRVEESTFFVKDGTFTTCDLDTPHYHFWAKDMKMVINDKVVARPIVLYFESVPVAIIPYGVFPNKRGRHSGMLIPVYGETAGQGRFLENVGYYFVLSDYTDLKTSINYYERYGFAGEGDFRYRIRYILDGYVAGSFVRKNFENRKDRRWDLTASHNQTIDPWTHLNVTLNLVSDNSYYTQTSTNIYQHLDKILRSDATLSHVWPGTPSSISLNLHHEQNLELNSFSQTMPRIQYRHSQTRIFQPPLGQTENLKWYHSLYWDYTAQGLNQRTAANTTGDRWRGGVRHTLNFRSPQSTFRYLSVTPSISLTDDWFAEWLDYRLVDHSVVPVNRDQLRQRLTFSLRGSATTKLYGIFLNPFGVGADFRHVMTPTITASYIPNFSERKWGYYGYLQIPDSTVYTWDKFKGNVFAPTPSSEQRTLGFDLDNLFQYKRTKEDQVIRRDLFTMHSSANYNFAAERFPWSTVTTSFRTSPISGGSLGPLNTMSVDLSLSHSLYQRVNGQQIERFVWQDFTWSDPKILRLLQSNLSLTFGLSGGGQRKTSFTPEPGTLEYQQQQETVSEEINPLETPQPVPALEPSPGWDIAHIPWDLNFSTHYSINKTTNTRYAWLYASLDFDLTSKWRIGYSSRLDLIQGNIVATSLSIYRDLHCWEGRFIWNPVGLGQGYYLRISVKAPQLNQDLKFEKQKGYASIPIY
jgi:lipopolysaccharide assembly outer membrane protein LptD (OstA)